MSARVAIVTGCGKIDGLGAAICRALAKKGISVVASDIAPFGLRNATDVDGDQSDPGMEGLVNEIRSKGGKAEHILCDVSSESDVANLVAKTIGVFGRLDIVVNNAAAPHGADYNDIVNVPVSAWEHVMRVNALGPLLLMREAVPHMRRQKWGRIVNIASVGGKVGKTKAAVYCSSKAALIQMTRCLALDLGPDGINVNAVCPGRMMSSRTLSDIVRREGPENVEAVLKARATDTALKRIADPSEPADLTAYLCSDESSYVTGQAINVDGGQYPM